MGDTAKEPYISRSNHKEGFPTEIQCTASRIGENDSLRVQLEAVRANGICTMEMVDSLVVMVSKLSSEVQQLRIDDTLKTQLRDLQQAPTHVPSTRAEAALSAIANNHIGMLCVQWVVTLMPPWLQLRLGICLSRPFCRAKIFLMAIL
jgi:hypothetical protein